MQQYLPFTVLKQDGYAFYMEKNYLKLQQYLPFTVLKLAIGNVIVPIKKVATVLTVYGIETQYQVRLHRRNHIILVATVLTVYGIETYKYRVYLPMVGCNSTYRLRY